MRPEIIIMLTHHDVTVKNAAEIFEQCKDIEEVKFWGFKNVGLPKDEMKALAGAMKAAGKTTFLEVVTYDEASCLDGAQTAIDCGYDYLLVLLENRVDHLGDELLGLLRCTTDIALRLHAGLEILEGEMEARICRDQLEEVVVLTLFGCRSYSFLIDISL